MSPTRYPSLAQRKQTFKRTEAELARALREHTTAAEARAVDVTYAEGLLPTLPGHVHGIVDASPWRIQCDACGAIEQPPTLVLMRTRFVTTAPDPRRLCESCREAAGYDR